ARQIAEAKAGGDISENAGYDEAKSSQAFLEGRIMELEYKLKHAVVIERDGNSDVVELGSIVTVRERDFDEEETYTIVGSAEADPSNGRISNESPIGRALMGHRVGDEVTAQTPGGTIYLQITQVR
ncbi:MAG TPA: transcription elongation factor GreA, partial [Anaerolineae bacterium]|nr:transcription elongation factor GreA [Anaerolineae bacterium]